ncbi:cadherin EGF LAG seven-pass G-type receptor 2-like, partial [Mya arenaria]|uniref:cadherin EGF LAG seven-pass G-type receptor 2-like n=1 Tax=Mya arenaria TaxID=6604 RepID=UPI0022DEB6C8
MATVTISVNNVNDNTPAFSPNFYFATVAENTASGSSISLLTVTDADGDALTITVAAGDDTSNKFKFSSGNPKLIETSSNVIDYETLSGANYKYTLVVEATDGTNTGTATVIVTVTNVNEATPSFVMASFIPATTPYGIDETSAVGTSIVTVTAYDADDGAAGEVVYSLGTITENTGSTTTGTFGVDPTSGVLSTIVDTFDCDTATGGLAYYDVIIVASDKGSTVKSATIQVRVGLVDVNDNTPTFAQNVYTLSIPETTAASTSLLTLTATDDDVTDAMLTFTLEASSSPSAYSSKFELDSNTAQLNLLATVDLDAGDASSYILVVSVSDGGSSALTSTTSVIVTVTSVNDAAPSVTGATVAIDESTAVGGAVTTVVATDADTGADGDLTFSISQGNSAGKFTIDPTTGAISVAGSLDYETTIQYLLTVMATDGGSTAQTGSATITVDINDVSDQAPTCSANSYYVSIDEPGVVSSNNYVTLACTDTDAVDTLTYSIASGNTGSKFSISTAGVITLASALDYDAGTQNFALSVQVTDSTTTLTIPVTIVVNPVNEATPTFGADVDVTFSENTAVGMSLATHAATDADASPHAVVSYSISSVTNSGLSKFSIDQKTGELSLAQMLDYETAISYVITVIAVDGGSPTPNTGTGTVTIQVSDVNDNVPTCSSYAHVLTVAEDAATNTAVISDLGCTDADGTTPMYIINTQTPASHFSIDTSGATPALVVGSALNYQTYTSYAIEIIVSDGSLTDTVYVDIAITDVNTGGPSFSAATYTTSIAENTAVSTSVFTVTATDPDLATSTYGKLTYSITAGNTGGVFVINPTTGRVSVSGVLDTETTPSYSLTVQVSEETGGNTDTSTLTITVTDVNDNTPTCTSDMTF